LSFLFPDEQIFPYSGNSLEPNGIVGNRVHATARAVDSGSRSAKIDFAGNPAADRGCVKAVRETVGSARTGSCKL
jgi:hypothetical protein